MLMLRFIRSRQPKWPYRKVLFTLCVCVRAHVHTCVTQRPPYSSTELSFIIATPFIHLWKFYYKESYKWTYQNQRRGFPGGAVVGSLPANAGDAGSSPGLGRSHMPQSGWAREPQLLSLRVWSCAPQQEGPRWWEARAPWWGVAPACRG